MEKGTRTSVIGRVVNSITTAAKSLLDNDNYSDDVSDIKGIDDYKPGELSKDNEDLILRIKELERKLEETRKRQKELKNFGAYELEARERVNASKLIDEIASLKVQEPNRDEEEK